MKKKKGKMIIFLCWFIFYREFNEHLEDNIFVSNIYNMKETIFVFIQVLFRFQFINSLFYKIFIHHSWRVSEKSADYKSINRLAIIWN